VSLFLGREIPSDWNDEPARGEGMSMNDGQKPSNPSMPSAEPIPPAEGGLPAGQPSRRLPRRWLLGSMVCLAIVLVVALFGKFGLWRHAAPSPTDLFPLTPLAASPYLNTRPDAHYVGSEACRSCHPGSFTSFSHSHMAHTLAELDPAQEPPDATFDHPLSKRRYEVRRKDGQLWHRELLLDPGQPEVVLAEYPLKFRIGSGNVFRLYAVEADGFLVESPLAWHTSQKAWEMSPGFDKAEQVGFGRPVPEMCMFCHAGQAEAVGGSLHRIQVTEPAISCERCHGPGSMHVARHQSPHPAGPTAGGDIDYTIVNPANLSRDLAEAVCAQCHLRTGASVVSRGRKQSDFRPGLPLQDFRQEYWFEVPNQGMTFLGHFAQLYLSRCYQASKDFSCLTCHDAHNNPEPKARDAYYNAICTSCHQPERCTVDARRRQQESPENNCNHCHMPRSSTEVRHAAFTHHRIGIHDKPTSGAGETTPRLPGEGVLRPILELSRLSELDRKRSLGMGYLDQSHETEDYQQAMDCKEKAFQLLSEARAAGLRDGFLEASLTRLRATFGLEGVIKSAERALAYPDLDGQDRCVVLYLYAEALAKEGRHKQALTALHQLTELRRNATDWHLRADCEKALGNEAAMVEALATAARINPRLAEVHAFLADYYRQQGNRERAVWHQQRAVP
jgi:predicted CXXCH cytochrome family protein